MKFLITLMLFLSLNLHAKIYIFTDIDDTIKQTDVLSIPDVIKGYVVGFKPFVFMADIFNEIINEKRQNGEEVELIYLSGSPKLLVDQKAWNKKYNFPSGTIIQKDLIGGTDLKNFKIQNINKILSRNDATEVYYFGDNGQYDVEAYLTIKNKYTSLRHHIFIRDVRTNAIPLSTDLKVNPKMGVKYFISELTLYEAIPFLSPDLYTRILNSKFDTVVAPFIQNRLAERLEDELKVDDDQSREQAANLLKKSIGYY